MYARSRASYATSTGKVFLDQLRVERVEPGVVSSQDVVEGRFGAASRRQPHVEVLGRRRHHHLLELGQHVDRVLIVGRAESSGHDRPVVLGRCQLARHLRVEEPGDEGVAVVLLRGEVMVEDTGRHADAFRHLSRRQEAKDLGEREFPQHLESRVEQLFARSARLGHGHLMTALAPAAA
jgi:hypothetical protein